MSDDVDRMYGAALVVDDKGRVLKDRLGLYSEAQETIKALNEQCRFWRRAAEQAVDGWNALEDKVQSVLEVANALEGNTAALRELLVELDPVEPPDLVQTSFVDLLGDGRKLRVVEDETPIAPATHKGKDD